jgi:FG-GAP-like repeat/FG-GAP repeat
MTRFTSLHVRCLLCTIWLAVICLSITNSHAQLVAQDAPLPGVYAYETLPPATSTAGFIAQANAQGARGFAYVGDKNFGLTFQTDARSVYTKNLSRPLLYSYESLPTPTTSSAQVLQLNAQGARGFRHQGDYVINGGASIAVYVNDSTGFTFAYKERSRVASADEFVGLANTEGALGYSYYRDFGFQTTPGSFSSVSIFEKSNAGNSTFSFEALNLADSAQRFVTQANIQGIRSFRFLGNFSTGDRSQARSIYMRNSSRPDKYVVESSNVASSTAAFLGQTNEAGGRGFKYLSDIGFSSVSVASIYMSAVGTPNDFSGDGKSDILLQSASFTPFGFSTSTGTTTALQMNGTTVLSSANLLNTDPNWTVTHTGDFDGDGKADILWRKTDGAVTIWTMNGTTVTSTAGLIGADASWRVDHVGDFNGDGYADLLWRNSNGAVTLWLMNGTTVMSAIGLLGPNANWSVSHVGDFNGDGKADILWRNIDGSVTIWLMNGGTVISAIGIFGADPNWRVSHVADFNGDGKADLLWRKADGSVTMWLMDGTAVTSATGILGADTYWSVSHTADFNGDGKSDILWCSIGGDVTIWLMNGASVSSTAGIYLGERPILTMAGFRGPPVWSVRKTLDLNGDGKADLVWSNQYNGSTTLWLMNGLAVTATAGLALTGSTVVP